MNISSIKQWFIKKATVLGILTASVAIIGATALLVSNNGAKAETTGDCTGNSVINCGINTIGDLKTDYTKNTQNIQQVYSSKPFGMDGKAMADFFANYKIGWVYADGHITVGNTPGGTTVATNALTAGRDAMSCDPNIPGEEPNTAGVFVRPPSCSFISSPLEAFLYMPNDQFTFAVLLSCGNPVVATPILPPSSLTCNSLTATPAKPADLNGDTEYILTAKASGTHAKINDYIFDTNVYEPNHKHTVVTSADTVTYNFVYPPGTSHAKVFVDWTDNKGVSHQTTSSNCEVTIVVPPAPALKCDSLTATPVGSADASGNREYKLEAKATADNGAKILAYKFSVDTNGPVNAVNTSATDASINHTYAPGTHNPSVIVDIEAAGKMFAVTSENCEAQFTVPSAPIFACTDLVLTRDKNKERAIEVQTTYVAKNGAKFERITYTWGDGKTTTITNPDTKASHQFSKFQKYNVEAKVTFKVNGQDVTPTPGKGCEKSITFAKPPTPNFACTLLNVNTQANSLAVTANVEFTNKNGATFKSATIDWGDQSSTDPITQFTRSSTGGTTTTVDHTYSQAGTFDITASAVFMVNGKAQDAVTGTDCQKQVQLTVPMCTVPGKENLPPNSPECTTAVLTSTTPTSLVNTGPGSAVALFGGASALGAIGHYLIRVRKIFSKLF